MPDESTVQMIGEPAAPSPPDSSATTVAFGWPSPSESITCPSITPVRTSLKPTRAAGAVTAHFSVSGSQPNFDARRK